MKKRILSIVLAICLVLSCVPITVFAANADATELQNKLNSGGTVMLSKDYTIDTTLNVRNTVTLDLNGHVIKMTGSGSVISIAWSNLTLQDSSPTATHTDASLPAGGVITGGNAAYGGGVYVGSGGSMTMNGGTIANCSAEYCGGVFVAYGTFTMNGGAIANCTATTSNYTYGGGGVYVASSATFTMNGGTIENCSSKTLGGGVLSTSNFSMSGNAIIRGCSAKAGGGVRIDESSMTMNGGTIEACTSTNGTSDAVTITSNASLLANGGIVKGTVTFGSYSAINTTSTDNYTKFYNEVTNDGTISGGVYYGGIQNDSSGTVSGTYHTVSFDTNGGSSVPTQWFVNTDKAPALQPAAPTKEGYQAFDGWYNGDTRYDFNQPVTQDITLKAKFSNPFAYNISCDLDGGTATNPATYTVESEDITLNNPVKTGYTFTGWSGTDLTGENKMTVTIAKGSTGDRTYTAHFSQNDYTVNFDTNGGSSISNKTSVKWTDTVLSGITNPTKAGCEFTGWKCGDKTVNANTKYSDLAADDTVKSVTLVAQWKDTEKPVITGLENNKTYCDAVEFTVSDNDGVASVKAGNTVLTPGTNGKYTLAKGIGTVTVVATDKAKNETTITVTVNNGHTYGEWKSNGNDTHTRYCTVAGCKGYEDGDCEGGQATYFNKAICDYCKKEYGSLLTDTTAPTGEITVGTSKWNTFLNTITFGLFFKNTQSVAVTATDDSYTHPGYTDDKAVKVEYYLYSGDTVLTQSDLASEEFTEYNSAFNINPDNKYVVYAKLTDHAGNVTYISSNGIVLDAAVPVITGVTDGAVYYTTQKAVVTDDNLKSVTLNDVSIDGTTVTLDGNTDEVYTIVATDKADNSTIVTVTMKSISSLAQSIDDVNGENVKSSNKVAIDAVKESVGEVDISNATDSEKEALNDINGRCDELLDIIDKAQKATQTENIKNVEGINPDNVTEDDRDALDKAKADLEKALEEYGTNYTDDELAKTQSNLERVNESLKVLDDVKAVEDLIAELPDSVEPDDLDTVQSILDANDAYNALTDYEKSLVSENVKEKLYALTAGISAYMVYEGSGGIWTIGQDGTLTFTANGAYSKFTGIKVDGKDVDESNYTAESGSTIITLNADYLNTLSVGTHTLTVLYTDGEAEAEFEVKEAPEEATNPSQEDDGKKDDTTAPKADDSMTSPKTDDDSYTALTGAIIFFIGGAVIFILLYSKRKKYNS